MQNKPSIKSISKIPTPRDWLSYNIQMTGLKQAAIADVLGVSRNVISMWTCGTQQIPLKHMATMAKIFGVDPLLARNIYMANIDGGSNWTTDERVRLLSELSQNELEFIEILREYSYNPKLSDRQREAFINFVKGLNPEEPHPTI